MFGRALTGIADTISIVALGVASVISAGAALVIARSRRRLRERAEDAFPGSLDRLERPTLAAS